MVWSKISFLQVSQIECDSTSMPWPGCLQYYMGVEGSDDDGIALMMVMEMIHMKLWVLVEKRGYINKVLTFKTRQVYNFNYFKPNDHLQDQHYNVCVRQEDDMCRFLCNCGM